MKWIKKVAATPLTVIAKVIDTLNTRTNERTNAPSIRAVNAALDTKANTTTVNTALATKADTTTVNAALATKADTSTVNTALAGKQNTLTGAATSIASSNLTADRALISNGSGKVAASSITSTILGYLSGLTGNVQTQINGKQDTLTGGATTIASSNLTASRALVSNGSGKVAASSVTSTELGYLSGASSSIQTQLNNKANTTSIPSGYRIRGGSIVRNVPAGYTYDLFTNAQLNEILGVNNSTNLNTIVLVANGDFEAHDNRADNVSYIISRGVWQVRFGDEASAGSYRFNYLVVYFG